MDDSQPERVTVSQDPTENVGLARCVLCILTRRRPRLLAAALDSVAALAPADGVDVTCLVVENDAEPSVEGMVNSANTAPGAVEFAYAHEPRIGIPFGRNRAVDYALENGFDFLAFVDDDETLDAYWLRSMVDHARATGPGLIGGPVALRFPEHSRLLPIQALLADSLQNDFRRKMDSNERLYRSGEVDRLNVVTNNWWVDIASLRAHGLRFDETLGASGVDDSHFCGQAKAAGVAVSWARNAVVYETVPLERLSISYQFRRARDQSTAHFGLWGRRSVGRVVVAILGKLIGLVPTAVLCALFPRRFLLPLVRTTGWVVGRILGLLGRTSSHYANTTGA
jgi:succinoglycan biosynthesis protein ExoM